MTTDPSTAPSAPAGATRVLVLNRDLFFGVRVRQALTADGWQPQLVPSAAALAGAAGDDPHVALIVVDMAADPDWPAVMAVAGTGDDAIPVLAFGAHRDVDRFRAAKAAGVTRVVSNGDFHRDITGIVRRYARAAATP